MYAKHRNRPGNGYRSNALGMGGVATASRIPPEGSMRGNRMYSSEYKNYNQSGYGSGGLSKQFQPPMPQPRDTDIFMEAGRMAAEYLVSKGVLPPKAISGRWQNDGLKNQAGNFEVFRVHEAEKLQMSADNRASVRSRVGNGALDGGRGRRRYSDDYNSMGSRSSIRGKKRTGSFKIYGTEVDREWGRSDSWAEKSGASPAMDTDSDASVVRHNEQPAGKDGNSGIQSSSPGEITLEDDGGTNEESGLEKCKAVENADAKDSALSNEKSLPSDAGEPAKKSDTADKLKNETEAIKEGRNDDDFQQKHAENKDVQSSGMEDILVSEERLDLVKHCKFVNVPTKARSSLTNKGSKGDGDHIIKDESYKRELSEDSSIHVIDVDIDRSAASASHQNLEAQSLQSDVSALENEVDVTYSMRSGLSGLGSSNYMIVERGEKRAIDFNTDDKEDLKKLRQWVPPPNAQSDISSPTSGSMENQPILQESGTSESAHLTPSSNQNNLDITLFPNDNDDSCEFVEEKKLFPSSFKTCDLNLVGACDVNENHDADPVFTFQPITRTGKATTAIDIDLSMSNNGNLPNKNGKHGVNGKDIEVIDLEKDSAHEGRTLSNPERRGDAAFTDLDGFPNNVHNANGIPDVQDGYGLMISQLLGNDSPNCSSIPTDLNSLHNHMGLPNTEGILGDDDSIYMSLGEIPISLLGSWDQPTQDYGKPF